MVPVLPEAFAELIYDPAVDSFAEGMTKTFVRLPVVWLKWLRYHVDVNGNITPEFEADICAIGCPGDTPTETEEG